MRRGEQMPERYDGVDFARRFVSDSYVPDDVAVEESVSLIRRTVGECRVYGLGETAEGRVDGDRVVRFIVVVPHGDTGDIRKRIVLGLVNMHLDAGWRSSPKLRWNPIVTIPTASATRHSITECPFDRRCYHEKQRESSHS